MLETLGVRKEHRPDVILLRVHHRRRRRRLLGLSSKHRQRVLQRLLGALAARAAAGPAPPLDGPHFAGGVDADEGTVRDEARSAVGNVGRHRFEAGPSSEGESGQPAHVEVGAAEDGGEVLLQGTARLVAGEGCGEERLSQVVARALRQGVGDHAHQVGVSEGSREYFVDTIEGLIVVAPKVDCRRRGVGAIRGGGGRGYLHG
mmetsp:Transcript_61855/g.182636  ORF Transcript_61855/g.182636 Transcript_61855/m.182636 type:complete len:203 (-) Transcript_61855:356-964(-)